MNLSLMMSTRSALSFHGGSAQTVQEGPRSSICSTDWLQSVQSSNYNSAAEPGIVADSMLCTGRQASFITIGKKADFCVGVRFKMDKHEAWNNNSCKQNQQAYNSGENR